MKKSLVFAQLLFSVQLSAAEFRIIPASETESIYHIKSGNDLAKWFTEDDDKDGSAFISGMLYGYTTGVVDSTANTLFCPPPNATVGQYKSIVGKYLNANPERRHLSAARLVIEALSSTYPCKDGK